MGKKHCLILAIGLIFVLIAAHCAAQRNPETMGIALHAIDLNSNKRFVSPSLTVGVRQNLLGNNNFTIGIGSKIGVGYPISTSQGMMRLFASVSPQQ